MMFLWALELVASIVAAAPISERLVARNPGIWVTPPSNGLPYLVFPNPQGVGVNSFVGPFGNCHLCTDYRDRDINVPLSSKTWTLSSIRSKTRKYRCSDCNSGGHSK